MSVQSTLARIGYTISGAGPYTIPYYFLKDTDLVVIRTPVVGDPVTLVLTTDYTVTGAGLEAGGTLTLVAPVNGDLLTIINEPPINQLSTFPETGKLPAKSIESALDKLTIVMKRAFDLASRGLRLNDGDAATSFVFPISSPGKLIGWGTGGELTNTSPTAVGPNSIGTAELVDGAVTANKIAGGALLGWPIGSVFIGVVATNPATLLGGGTWVSFGAGRVLVGLDATQTEFDTVEETGGAKTHTLTTAEIPAHLHAMNADGKEVAKRAGVDSSIDFASSTVSVNDADYTGSQDTGLTGGGGAHNNLQPYIVVYFWKRTA